MNTSAQAEWVDTLGQICESAAAMLQAGPSFNDFRNDMVPLALHMAAVLGLPFDGQITPAHQAMTTHLAVELWNVTPRLGLDLALPTPIKLHTSQSCPCGSGKTYGKCCGAIRSMPLNIPPEWLGASVLHLLPQTSFKKLPLHALPVGAVLQAAQDDAAQGESRRALALLEQLFVDLDKLAGEDPEAEGAADLLLTLYAELNHATRRERFLERLLGCSHKALRSAALQIQSAMLCDMGEYEAAQAAFLEAQHLTPNAPSLAQLEIITLVAQGRQAEAQARAEFWGQRLARDKQHDYAELIHFLESMAHAPDETMLQMEADSAEGPIPQLWDVILSWPDPATQLHYGAGLLPTPELAKLEKRWAKNSPMNPKADGLTWFEDLVKHPILGQSLQVLADLSQVISTMLPGSPGALQALHRTLARYGANLRQALLAAGHIHPPLAWDHPPSRAVLVLAFEEALLLRRQDPQQAEAVLRWLLTEADPSDQLEVREPLIHLLLDQGQPAEALALIGPCAEDNGALLFGHVLSYFANGQTEVAAQVLQQAARSFPRLWKLLEADSVSKPRSSDSEETELAREYRREYRPLWKRLGALDWARTVLPAKVGAKAKG